MSLEKRVVLYSGDASHESRDGPSVTRSLCPLQAMRPMRAETVPPSRVPLSSTADCSSIAVPIGEEDAQPQCLSNDIHCVASQGQTLRGSF
ncbi:hypothetical protein CgunFtcFv8_015960 [Champsocephalus gunnari]|uniref:Uncharacterized protein n=1 Tax=Champsocephalus gunnari TaxID=52237 RepID=A0AAN8C7E2_CHAGU|nr:hypothetical protein CgunFtcFv8_015960 [Champsocephalus gunnari]